MRSSWFKFFVIFTLLLAVCIALINIYWPENIEFPGFNNSKSKSNKPAPSLYSLNGIIKNISADIYTLTLADGKTDKDFKVPSDVQVVKRSSVGLVVAKFVEIKIGSQVVFYTKSDPSLSNPVITKVELIN